MCSVRREARWFTAFKDRLGIGKSAMSARYMLRVIKCRELQRQVEYLRERGKGVTHGQA